MGDLAEVRKRVAEAARAVDGLSEVLDARAAVLEATKDVEERRGLLQPLSGVLGLPPEPEAGQTPWTWDAASREREIPPGVLTFGDEQWGGPVLPVGDVAILAGLGGAGKSLLALQIAVSAAGAEDGDVVHVLRPRTMSRDRPGLGRSPLEVRGGGVVLVGYEDRAAWVRMRALGAAAWLDGGPDGPCRKAVDDPERLSVAVGGVDAPLFAPPAPGGPATPTAAWERVWERVREVGAGLVVVDPVALAWDAGAEGYPVGPVGRFIGALHRDAVENECAVLLVHHVTKAARSAQREGRRLDAADISGSHAWVDRVRGTLQLQSSGAVPKKGGGNSQGDAAADEDWVWKQGWLGVTKANCSPSGGHVGWIVDRVDAAGLVGPESGRPVAWIECAARSEPCEVPGMRRTDGGNEGEDGEAQDGGVVPVTVA